MGTFMFEQVGWLEVGKSRPEFAEIVPPGHRDGWEPIYRLRHDEVPTAVDVLADAITDAGFRLPGQ